MMFLPKLDILGFFVLFCMIGICLYMYFDRDEFQLKCIVSTVDGNKYCVRERTKLQDAADLLARVADKMQRLVMYIHETYPDNPISQRLYTGFSRTKIMETLPTSDLTAYSLNKGEKISFCLNREKQDNNRLIDEHTLTFVAIHELSHIGTESIGHQTDFWENFQLMLIWAKESGIHEPAQYKEKPVEYCGMKIRDNPYYDLSKSSKN
jgi:hypothetical protein